MMQNYFIFNGISYYSGTIIKIKASNSCVKTTEAVFLGYETDRHKYVLSYEGNKEVWYPEDFFNDIFIGVTKSCDKQYQNWVDTRIYSHNHSPTFADELNIDGMFIAWIWYVFIMVVAIIFKDRLVIWIFASIIFFNYRNEKLRKAGYKK